MRQVSRFSLVIVGVFVVCLATCAGSAAAKVLRVGTYKGVHGQYTNHRGRRRALAFWYPYVWYRPYSDNAGPKASGHGGF